MKRVLFVLKVMLVLEQLRKEEIIPVRVAQLEQIRTMQNQEYQQILKVQIVTDRLTLNQKQHRVTINHTEPALPTTEAQAREPHPDRTGLLLRLLNQEATHHQVVLPEVVVEAVTEAVEEAEVVAAHILADPEVLEVAQEEAHAVVLHLQVADNILQPYISILI